MSCTVENNPGKNVLSATGKAWLTSVAIRHKDVGDVFVKLRCERPVPALEFDKRVILLIELFRFQTAQSISEIEILLLESLQFGSVSEER
ncbi:hypothetical protein, partial [Flavobacterium sp.]|uniref:hypothetical protein n=1 Tax=Flavobacterium sp. TaxID=239 RepID=UPI0037C02AC7